MKFFCQFLDVIIKMVSPRYFRINVYYLTAKSLVFDPYVMQFFYVIPDLLILSL